MSDYGYSNEITFAMARLLDTYGYWDEKYTVDNDFCYLLDNALEQKSLATAMALTEYVSDDFGRKVHHYFDITRLNNCLEPRLFYSVARICFFRSDIKWLEIVVKATNIEINDLKY